MLTSCEWNQDCVSVDGARRRIRYIWEGILSTFSDRERFENVRTVVSAAENGDLIVHRHELDCDWPHGGLRQPACLPAHLGARARARLRGRENVPWQFRFFMAAFSGLVWSLPVYQNTSRRFSAPFPSELSAVYILCTTSSFVPPWNGITSPWSLKPRPRYNVTRTPRRQASRVPETMGEALKVGV
jgi:hypothetical protein